jgi:hypothetical protein
MKNLILAEKLDRAGFHKLADMAADMANMEHRIHNHQPLGRALRQEYNNMRELYDHLEQSMAEGREPNPDFVNGRIDGIRHAFFDGVAHLSELTHMEGYVRVSDLMIKNKEPFGQIAQIYNDMRQQAGLPRANWKAIETILIPQWRNEREKQYGRSGFNKSNLSGQQIAAAFRATLPAQGEAPAEQARPGLLQVLQRLLGGLFNFNSEAEEEAEPINPDEEKNQLFPRLSDEQWAEEFATRFPRHEKTLPEEISFNRQIEEIRPQRDVEVLTQGQNSALILQRGGFGGELQWERDSRIERELCNWFADLISAGEIDAIDLIEGNFKSKLGLLMPALQFFAENSPSLLQEARDRRGYQGQGMSYSGTTIHSLKRNLILITEEFISQLKRNVSRSFSHLGNPIVKEFVKKNKGPYDQSTVFIILRAIINQVREQGGLTVPFPRLSTRTDVHSEKTIFLPANQIIPIILRDQTLNQGVQMYIAKNKALKVETPIPGWGRMLSGIFGESLFNNEQTEIYNWLRMLFSSPKELIERLSQEDKQRIEQFLQSQGNEEDLARFHEALRGENPGQ